MSVAPLSLRASAASALLFLCAACGGAEWQLELASTDALLAAPGEGSQEAAAPTLTLEALRCEHEDEPLDLETRAPRFSWKLAAVDPARRGLVQGAYRVLVASSVDELAEERGDLWDSGRVASRDTLDVAYAGRALESFEHAVWKVQVFDGEGVASAWSALARFGMGALEPSDWRAQWIGLDAAAGPEKPAPDLKGAEWIRAPLGERMLWVRRRFEVASEAELKAGLVLAVADDFELYLNGALVLKDTHAQGTQLKAQILKITKALVPGTNVLAARVRSSGPTPAALALKLVLRPGTAREEQLLSDARWRAAPQPLSGLGWEQTGFDDSAWQPCALLSASDEDALGPIDLPEISLPPPRTLRGEFQCARAPVRATLFASALGAYVLELNGARVGEDCFAPGWTDYTKRIPYRAYDVTALVHAGANALGAELADGWYAGYLGKRGQRDHYGSRPRFLAQLVLEDAHGARTILGTDSSWRATRAGPRREADLYMGESYDARAELGPWSSPGFDASAWSAVDVGPAPAARLVSHSGPEIRALAELAPVALTARPNGRWLFDLGQNFAGVARLAVEAPAGTQLVLKFGEALERDGALLRNTGWARATDRYVCKGGGLERWQPRFTYHGFRYVEVAGLVTPPTKATLTGVALSSATTDVGAFACSDERLTKLVENARWTLRANSMDVPTDCPQRGERLGWTGDAQLFAPSALWLADLQSLYDKWSLDLADAQRADGDFPAIAPAWENVGPGGAAWADAGVLVPATLYDFTGDWRLLERQYPSMQRFLAAREARLGPELAPPADGAGYGDWLNLGAETPRDLLELAYSARCARRVASLALVLGHKPDVERYNALYERLWSAFVARCVDAEGHVRGETQTGYALALRDLLVPPDRREQTSALFLADLDKRGGITTGFVGTSELLPALSSIARADVAYHLLAKREFPSWGYMLDQGATTLWERWDAWTEERGFANHGNVSLAHTPLGSFVAWLFDTCAGIRPAAPGFERVTLAPVPGGELTWAEASYDSVRGRIALRWELVGDELRLDVTLPPNVAGSLLVPTRAPDSLTEGGRAIREAPGVRVGRVESGGVFLELVPGRYSFACLEPLLAR